MTPPPQKKCEQRPEPLMQCQMFFWFFLPQVSVAGIGRLQDYMTPKNKANISPIW